MDLFRLTIVVTALVGSACRLFGADGAACLDDVNCPEGKYCCQGECQESCPDPPVCGDGDMEGTEECDHGADNADDSFCTTVCRLARCGDGLDGPAEACDDGNTADGDYCAADCSAVTTVCGDGEVERPQEECDNGDDNSNVTPDACRSDCTAARCGDGVRDSGESCDSEGCCNPIDCTMRTSGECRPVAGDCDVAEVCDGVSLDCPFDAVLQGGTECRSVAGDCDLAEVCDGVAALCPLDLVITVDAPCRPSDGPCDIVESCDGVSPLCPDDVRDSTSVCRSADFECDAIEYCDGLQLGCPVDEVDPDATPCRGGECQSGECIGTGLSGAYYDNRSLVGDPEVVQIDPVIDFVWGAEPVAGVGPNSFSVRWRGELRAEIVGPYEFRTTSDDGVRLFIDGVLLIDDWLAHPLTTNNATVDLDAGRHSIVFEFFDNIAGAEVNLRWRPPTGGNRVTIPTSHLYPTYCGNGVVESGEACDGLCCNQICSTLLAADTICRPFDDECDLVERCDGVTDVCPADARETDGDSCSTGLCDAGTCLAATHFEQDSGGDFIVSVEAESYDRRIRPGAQAWELLTDPSASGGEAMRAEPAQGEHFNPPWQDYSPRLDFKVHFVTDGLHFIWIRGHAASNLENSCLFGLDGMPAAPHAGVLVTLFGAWVWSNDLADSSGEVQGAAMVDVPSSGEHIVNIWMREDGFTVDKIVLTPNSNYQPVLYGPTESTREAD